MKPISAPISATDAITPAFRRAISVLTEPFQFGFFLKVVVLATLSESNLIAMGILLPMQASNLLFQFLMARRGGSSASPLSLPHLLTAIHGPALFVALAIAALFSLAISAVLFYLFTRLRFVIFEAVLIRERKFSRPWSKYSSQSWRYYGMSILVALASMLMAAAVASPIVLLSVRMLRSAPSDSGNSSGSFMGYFLLSTIVQYSLIFVAVVVDGWTHDFVMPAMAIENASIEASTGRFIALVREDPAAIFVYTLLRLALRMALTVALLIVTLLPTLILAVIVFGVGALLYHLLWTAGIVAQTLVGVYALLTGLLILALYMVAIFTASGVVAVFTQAYALIFYADRYPELGNILHPPSLETSPNQVGSKPEILPQPDHSPPFLPEPPALW